MAYQSAKQNRRSVAGGSLLASSRKSFTHQVFRPNQATTHLDSIQDTSRTNNLLRDTECSGYINTTENTLATQESIAELRQNELSNNSNQAGNTQFLLCKFFAALVQAEECLMKEKADFLDLRFDLENRFGRKFSPVALFQRIDRAGKGHLTRADVLQFLKENDFLEGHGFTKDDLKLIFKESKTKFQKFVKLIIDHKLEHRGSFYFNERQQENDFVLRKIDKLPPKLERAFCELLLQQINLKKELDFFREEIKIQKGYQLLELFKGIVFENQGDAAKQIFVSDVMRFFRFNKLLIEQQRVESILFRRVVGHDRPFDYSRLHKLLTKSNLESIVHNPGVQVSGLKADCRRNVEHRKSLNEKALSSLTGPQRLNQTQQNLRNRTHNTSKVWLSGPEQSCKLEWQTSHTKCFHTDHITDQELVTHLQTYLQDMLVLEEELEDTRIRLASERDFFPKVCFKTFLATKESRERMRVNEDDSGAPSDGLSELEASATSIYAFIKVHSASTIGMCQKSDLEALLVEFMRQRHQNVPSQEQQGPIKLKYLDFLAMIQPKNRDFSSLMQHRQTDFDLQQHENAYIQTIITQREEGMTSCRVARQVFIEEEMHSNVTSLLAETLLKIVLTHLRNIEVTRTYEKNTKGRHETQHVLRYVPQADAQSVMIRTADVLRFVKGPVPAQLDQSKISESRHIRSSSHYTVGKATAASTADMLGNSSLFTPNDISRRQEFDLIKSHEKEALYLSDRFGGRVPMRMKELETCSLEPLEEEADPGFAPDVLHLSKTKIDDSTRLFQ